MTRSTLRQWLILLAIALAARAITFGNPILHVDEEFYFVTARAMLDGAVPFLDIWDRKPIGLFLLYAPAAELGYPAGIWAYQAMALACLVATAALVMHLARRAGWERGAWAAGIATILWPNLLDGQGGQSPIFYNLLMIAAVAIVAPRTHGEPPAARRFAEGLAAMALVGLSLQIKYSVVFEGAYIGLWLLWREWRAGTPLPRIALVAVPLAGIAFAPSVAAWAWYAAAGHGEAWMFANFWSILDRQSDPWFRLLGNAAILALVMSPLMVGAGMARHHLPADPGRRPVALFLCGWAIVAVLGVLVFGSWFNHYGLPLIPPLAVCAAGFLGAHRRFAIGMLALAALVGQVTLGVKRTERGTPAQVAAVARVIGSGPGCLHVYSGSTMLYTMTGRCAVTRWIFPSHLNRDRERGAIGVDQMAEIDRILARRPEWVVMRKPYRGELPDVRARMIAGLRRDYRPVTTLPMGNERYALWRRGAPPARSAISSE